jgi:quercetin dioxygenase-like cupin family protein
MKTMGTLLALTSWLVVSAAAGAADPPPVQLEQSAYHVPVFKNQYVTVLNIDIPPGGASDFHQHNRDQVSIYLADYPKEAKGREWGGPVKTIRPNGNGPYAGDVSFNGYYKDPIVNLGINDTKGPQHMYMVATLLNSPKVYGFSPETRETQGYKQVLDNDRVRAWRLDLQPGETAPTITQQAPGLRVVVHGGNIVEMSPGKRDRGEWLKAGDFFWQEPGTSRAIKNIGATPVEFIEVEYK